MSNIPKVTITPGERAMAIKHGALINFSAAIGQIPGMTWYQSQRLTERLATLGKPTKDLTLGEVMRAMQADGLGEMPHTLPAIVKLRDEVAL